MKKRQSSKDLEQSNSKQLSIEEKNSEERVKTFQMTASQADAIQKLLPKKFSLGVHVKKSKRATPSLYRFPRIDNQDEVGHNSLNSANYETQAQQFHTSSLVARKCKRILSLLRRCNYSQPFKEPNEPTEMKDQDQSKLIQQPMDLKTIGQKVRLLQYRSVNQFFYDVDQMVKNGYENNQDSQRLTQIIQQFDKYYSNLKLETLIDQTPEKKGKPIKKQQHRRMTTGDKRKLRQRLMKLPQERLKKIISKLNDEKNSERLDLNSLSEEKLRQVQQYAQEEQLEMNKEVREDSPSDRHLIKRQPSESISDS